MSDKGFFASICSFFGGLFASEADSSNTPSAPVANDGITSVERYIRNQATTTTVSNSLTSVEAYIQANLKPLSSVEQYIRNQAAAKPLTTVEQYIRNNG